MANEKGCPVTSKSSSLKEMKMIIGLQACGYSTVKPRIIISSGQVILYASELQLLHGILFLKDNPSKITIANP